MNNHQEENDGRAVYSIVQFPSLDAMLAAKLYIPAGKTEAVPIVIMAHGFSATIDGMVADRYAEVFSEAGIAVLLYDHYSFGRSGGEPRYLINRWIQARGYCDAIEYVHTLPEIDRSRIALWGDSMSAAEVIVVGAVDTRVKAIVAQVPACGREAPPEDTEGKLFQAICDTLRQDNLLSIPATIDELMPVVSYDQINTPSLLEPITAFKWFIDYGAIYGTNWENKARRMTQHIDVPFHPGLCAPYLKAALLMMISHEDEMPGAKTSVARDVFERAPEPKERIDIEGGHFGIVYYPGKLFEEASRNQRDFLRKHL